MERYSAEFAALALVHFLAVLAPGPDFAVTISQSVRHGRRAGVWTALGIGAGLSVHVVYTVLGVGVLMHASAWLLNAAKIVGALYIGYLAVKLLQARPAGLAANLARGSVGRQEVKKSFAIGFFTNASNPKVTLFFLAVFTTMVSAATPLYVQSAYGVWMCLVNAAWFVSVALFFSHERVRAGFLQTGHWFERAMGLLLLVFAVRLLWSMSV